MGLKQCPKCDRQFTKAEHLKRHQRSHTQERPYECPLCKKRFARRHSRCHKRAYSVPMTEHRPFQGLPDPGAPTPQLPLSGQTLPYQPPGLNPQQLAQNPTDSGADQIIHQVHPLQNVDPSLGPSPAPTLPTSQQWLPNPPSSSLSHTRNASIPGSDQQSLYPMNVPSVDSDRPQPSYAPYSGNIMDYGNGMSHPDARNPTNTTAGVADDPTNALQWWLDQSDPLDFQGNTFNLEIGTGSGMFTPIPDDIVIRFSPSQFRPVTEGSVGGRGMPTEQFDIVKDCWPIHPNKENRLKDDLWLSLFFSPNDNIFATDRHSAQASRNSGVKPPSHGIDEACRVRLRKEFEQIFTEELPGPDERDELAVSSTHSSARSSSQFPPVELFDIALTLYFRNFHPTIPFIHVPTFNPATTDASLLFAICLVGLSILGTSGARKFVASSFPALLRKVSLELAQSSTQNRPVAEQITVIATACLTVNLAGMTGDKTRISSAQFLYANLYSFATQYGVFGSNNCQTIKELYDQAENTDQRWKAWSRIESAKRLIIGLIMCDAFYSNYVFNMPAIRGEVVHFVLPCEDALFEADSAAKWTQLLSWGKNIDAPIITPRIKDSFPINPTDRFEPFSMYSLLTFLNLRLYEAYHRLIFPALTSSQGTSDESLLIPSTTYALDLRARSLGPLVLSLSCTPKDLNSMALWNHLCLLLTTDIRTFELAAGYEGKAAAEAAFSDIAIWARTPAARRACLHSAQVYAVVSNRKISDAVRVRLDTVTSVFVSALVLSFYLCMAPPPPPPQVQTPEASSSMDNNGSIANPDRISAPESAPRDRLELSDPVDWSQIGDVGLLPENSSNNNRPEASSSSPTIAPPTAVDEKKTTHTQAAIDFIRYGGSISFNGDRISGDYHSARRVLLEYASLMEGMGKWSSKTSSQVLHVLADTIMQVSDA